MVDEVQRAVHAFFDGTSVGEQVCVSSVKVVPQIPGDADGRYHANGRRIRVEASGWAIGPATTHELCHAAEMQLSLDLSDAERWKLGLDFADELQTANRRARESYAYTCMNGPLAIQLLASATCEDDPRMGAVDAVAELFDVPSPWLSDRVPHFTPLLAWAPESGAGRLVGAWGRQGSPTITLDLSFPLPDGETDTEPLHLDLWTGQQTVGRGRVSEVPPTPESLSPWVRVIDRAGTPESSVMVVEATLGNGATTRRVWHHGPAGWTHLGCARDTEFVFATEGLLGSVYVDEDGGGGYGLWSVLPPTDAPTP